MQIKVTGKNLDVGDALREHIESRLGHLKQKYFEGSVHAHVTVEKQRAGFHTECALHLSTGLVLQAEGMGYEAHPSFDQAASHLEKQLKRYKQRLRDHHRTRREPVRQLPAQSYVIPAATDASEEAAECPSRHRGGDGGQSAGTLGWGGGYATRHFDTGRFCSSATAGMAASIWSTGAPMGTSAGSILHLPPDL